MRFSEEKVIANRLAQLERDGGGRLTPEAVVEDAKDEKSPLHRHFEWDDSEAARKYRLGQARDLIRRVKIERRVTYREIPTPRYVRDPAADSKEQGYVNVATIRDEKELARRTVKTELSRIVAAIERARGIADELGLDQEFEGLLAQVQLFRNKAEVAA